MVLQWTLLNSFVALMGYYFAAFTIDLKWMGRFRMQSTTGSGTWLVVPRFMCMHPHVVNGGSRVTRQHRCELLLFALSAVQ